MGKGETLVFVGLVLGSFAALINAADDPLCANLPAGKIVPFPHEYNCSLFYECLDGTKTLNKCPGDFYYNEKEQSCDFQDTSGCTNKPPPGGPPDCKGVNIGYFPDTADCTLYYECYEEKAYHMSCPKGFEYSSKQKLCVKPEDSDCGFNPPTKHPPTKAPPVTPPWTTPHPLCWGVRPGERVLKRYDGDCSKYWVCTGSQLTSEKCPNGLYFEEEKQACNFPDLVSCDGSTMTPDPRSTLPGPGQTTERPITPNPEDPRCTDGTVSYWPHPAFCNMYIECYKSSSYEMTCPPGLDFDDGQKKCIDASKSDCGRTAKPPTIEPPTTRIPPPHPDPECKADGTLIPDENDCTKYYECANSQKVEMNCPNNLWFNPILLVCDYPYQAGCKAQ